MEVIWFKIFCQSKPLSSSGTYSICDIMSVFDVNVIHKVAKYVMHYKLRWEY